MFIIPEEALVYFENAIYLPIIIGVLERDLESIKNGPFKLKGPYINLIDEALKTAHFGLKETNNYLKRNNMRVIKGKNDGTFTEYAYANKGHEDKRRYLNVRLRNRTEELINLYYAKVEYPNLKG